MDTLIIGDSIIKYISPYVTGDVVCFPGITIGRLIHKLGQVSLSEYSNIIVHVGTNNIGYIFPSEVISLYCYLIDTIRSFNPR